jgi:aerobic C4-dicarboxylate transport protein
VFYLTAALFVVVVLGLIARIVGFNILKFFVYIKDELLIVFGTSSSESALPQLMEKLERLGCSKPVVIAQNCVWLGNWEADYCDRQFVIRRMQVR